MEPDILTEVQRLRTAHAPFALATVVAVQHPTSGTLGARAIVRPDGSITGWIGGSCAQPTVVRESLRALADGACRLLMLRPASLAPSDPRPGVVEVPMACASQGELQIFVEPFLPRSELVVIGATPVARTLTRLGALLDFDVCACDPEADPADFPEATSVLDSLEALASLITTRSLVVVATIGGYDEEALLALVASPASYVGLVASQKRFAAVLAYLRERGVSPETLARIRRPEGLPSKTLVPSEIAFSVMAELMLVRRELARASAVIEDRPDAEAIDPICGMAVSIKSARYTSVRDGTSYYFCAARCQAEFEAG
jgi:xanthine dehydrogenase accessory factor